MKKTLCLLLCMLMAFSMAACGGGEEEEEQAKEYTYEIGMLTAADDVSIDDESDVQAAWEGVRDYAEEKGLTYKYYEAEEPTADAMVKRVGEAVEEGVRIIVACGPEAAEGVAAAQDEYPDVYFICLDGVPVDDKGEEKIADNCIAIEFKTLEAGFLAGYSAVLEGFNYVAYMADGESEEAKAYGHGFLQGCNVASDRFNRYTFVKYTYGNENQSTADVKKQAKIWYDNGVDAIFAYGASTFDGVKSAAKDAEKVVIAANVAKDYNKTVITAGMKCYKEVTARYLDAVYAGDFDGGASKMLNAKSGGVGLDMKHSTFTYFNQELYDDIVKELGTGELKLASVKSADTPEELLAEKQMYYVNLQEIIR